MSPHLCYYCVLWNYSRIQRHNFIYLVEDYLAFVAKLRHQFCAVFYTPMLCSYIFKWEFTHENYSSWAFTSNFCILKRSQYSANSSKIILNCGASYEPLVHCSTVWLLIRPPVTNFPTVGNDGWEKQKLWCCRESTLYLLVEPADWKSNNLAHK